MSRLEMLKWCFENILESENSLEHITSTIGLNYACQLLPPEGGSLSKG